MKSIKVENLEKRILKEVAKNADCGGQSEEFFLIHKEFLAEEIKYAMEHTELYNDAEEMEDCIVECYLERLIDCDHEEYEVFDDETPPSGLVPYDDSHEYQYALCKYCGHEGIPYDNGLIDEGDRDT